MLLLLLHACEWWKIWCLLVLCFGSLQQMFIATLFTVTVAVYWKILQRFLPGMLVIITTTTTNILFTTTIIIIAKKWCHCFLRGVSIICTFTMFICITSLCYLVYWDIDRLLVSFRTREQRRRWACTNCLPIVDINLIRCHVKREGVFRFTTIDVILLVCFITFTRLTYHLLCLLISIFAYLYFLLILSFIIYVNDMWLVMFVGFATWTCLLVCLQGWVWSNQT